MKSESINEVISFLHQSTAKNGNVPVLKISNKFWNNTSFIDALFVEGGNKTPHSLMHSLLMEVTNHLIY
jgi:uncharacterized protein YihD (DUF1040 family)